MKTALIIILVIAAAAIIIGFIIYLLLKYTLNKSSNLTHVQYPDQSKENKPWSWSGLIRAIKKLLKS